MGASAAALQSIRIVRTPLEAPSRVMALQKENPVVADIKKLRAEFELKYHRQMTDEEAHVPDVVEKLIRENAEPKE